MIIHFFKLIVAGQNFWDDLLYKEQSDLWLGTQHHTSTQHSSNNTFLSEQKCENILHSESRIKVFFHLFWVKISD